MTLIPKAVSSQAGERVFFLNDNEQQNSLLEYNTSERRYFRKYDNPAGTIKVETITLDDFCAAENIQRINILKMDIQGGEFMALQGAKKILQRQEIDLIYLEVRFVPNYKSEILFPEMATFLGEFQYSLFDLFHPLFGTNGQLRETDALFVSSRIRKEVVDAFPEEK